MNAFDEAARTTGFRPAEVTGIIGSVWTDPDEALAQEWVAAWDEAHALARHEGDGCSMDPLLRFARPDGLLLLDKGSLDAAGFEALRGRWMAAYAQGRPTSAPADHDLASPSASAVESILLPPSDEQVRFTGSLVERAAEVTAADQPLSTAEWARQVTAGDLPPLPSLAERLRPPTTFFELPARTSHAEQAKPPTVGEEFEEFWTGRTPDEQRAEAAEAASVEADVERSDEWSLFDEMGDRIEAYRLDLQAAHERADRLEAELAATRRSAWKYLRDVACVAVGAFGVVLVTVVIVLPGWGS